MSQSVPVPIQQVDLNRARRDALALALHEHPLGRAPGLPPLAVLRSPGAALRNNTVEHPFRADSDVAYLTGFEEPETVLVVLADDDGARSILFVRPRDPEREIWDGRRAGPEGARDVYGVDEAYPLPELSRRLPELMRGRGVVFAHLGREPGWDRIVLDAMAATRAATRRAGRAPVAIADLGAVLHPMRQRKDANEVAALEAALRATAAGHLRAMRGVRPGLLESDLEAALGYEFRRAGARRHGYEPIVAGGENACILHYIENDAPLREGDLVLIDAGAEVALYTGDVTRTFPVGGRFSEAQRALYGVVLAANEAAIAAARPGQSLRSLDDIARRTLAEGLVRLGLLAGDPVDVATRKPVEGAPPGHPGRAPLDRFYMHSTGHWLGMDVHDVGPYHDGQDPLPFEPGMVITVEPGVYIAAHDETVPEAYRGIGIRIEDDVLITEHGNRVLSAAIPKSVETIEAIVGTEPLHPAVALDDTAA